MGAWPFMGLLKLSHWGGGLTMGVGEEDPLAWHLGSGEGGVGLTQLRTRSGERREAGFREPGQLDLPASEQLLGGRS